MLAAQVDRLLVDVLLGDSGTAHYQVWAEVRNRGEEHLTVRLPAGAGQGPAPRPSLRLRAAATRMAAQNQALSRSAPLGAAAESP